MITNKSKTSLNRQVIQIQQKVQINESRSLNTTLCLIQKHETNLSRTSKSRSNSLSRKRVSVDNNALLHDEGGSMIKIASQSSNMMQQKYNNSLHSPIGGSSQKYSGRRLPLCNDIGHVLQMDTQEAYWDYEEKQKAKKKLKKSQTKLSSYASSVANKTIDISSENDSLSRKMKKKSKSPGIKEVQLVNQTGMQSHKVTKSNSKKAKMPSSQTLLQTETRELSKESSVENVHTQQAEHFTKTFQHDATWEMGDKSPDRASLYATSSQKLNAKGFDSTPTLIVDPQLRVMRSNAKLEQPKLVSSNVVTIRNVTKPKIDVKPRPPVVKRKVKKKPGFLNKVNLPQARPQSAAMVRRDNSAGVRRLLLHSKRLAANNQKKATGLSAVRNMRQTTYTRDKQTLNTEPDQLQTRPPMKTEQFFHQNGYQKQNSFLARGIPIQQLQSQTIKSIFEYPAFATDKTSPSSIFVKTQSQNTFQEKRQQSTLKVVEVPNVKIIKQNTAESLASLNSVKNDSATKIKSQEATFRDKSKFVKQNQRKETLLMGDPKGDKDLIDLSPSKQREFKPLLQSRKRSKESNKECLKSAEFDVRNSVGHETLIGIGSPNRSLEREQQVKMQNFGSIDIQLSGTDNEPFSNLSAKLVDKPYKDTPKDDIALFSKSPPLVAKEEVPNKHATIKDFEKNAKTISNQNSSALFMGEDSLLVKESSKQPSKEPSKEPSREEVVYDGKDQGIQNDMQEEYLLNFDQKDFQLTPHSQVVTQMRISDDMHPPQTTLINRFSEDKKTPLVQKHSPDKASEELSNNYDQSNFKMDARLTNRLSADKSPYKEKGSIGQVQILKRSPKRTLKINALSKAVRMTSHQHPSEYSAPLAVKNRNKFLTQAQSMTNTLEYETNKSLHVVPSSSDRVETTAVADTLCGEVVTNQQKQEKIVTEPQLTSHPDCPHFTVQNHQMTERQKDNEMIQELKRQLAEDDRQIYDLVQIQGGYKYDSQYLNKAILQKIRGGKHENLIAINSIIPSLKPLDAIQNQMRNFKWSSATSDSKCTQTQMASQVTLGPGRLAAVQQLSTKLSNTDLTPLHKIKFEEIDQSTRRMDSNPQKSTLLAFASIDPHSGLSPSLVGSTNQQNTIDKIVCGEASPQRMSVNTSPTKTIDKSGGNNTIKVVQKDDDEVNVSKALQSVPDSFDDVAQLKRDMMIKDEDTPPPYEHNNDHLMLNTGLKLKQFTQSTDYLPQHTAQLQKLFGLSRQRDQTQMRIVNPDKLNSDFNFMHQIEVHTPESQSEDYEKALELSLRASKKNAYLLGRARQPAKGKVYAKTANRGMSQRASNSKARMLLNVQKTASHTQKITSLKSSQAQMSFGKKPSQSSAGKSSKNFTSKRNSKTNRAGSSQPMDFDDKSIDHLELAQHKGLNKHIIGTNISLAGNIIQQASLTAKRIVRTKESARDSIKYKQRKNMLFDATVARAPTVLTQSSSVIKRPQSAVLTMKPKLQKKKQNLLGNKCSNKSPLQSQDTFNPRQIQSDYLPDPFNQRTSIKSVYTSQNAIPQKMIVRSKQSSYEHTHAYSNQLVINPNQRSLSSVSNSVQKTPVDMQPILFSGQNSTLALCQ